MAIWGPSFQEDDKKFITGPLIHLFSFGNFNCNFPKYKNLVFTQDEQKQENQSSFGKCLRWRCAYLHLGSLWRSERRGRRGPPNNQMWFLPSLCLPFHKDSERSYNSAACEGTLTHTQCNSQRLFLSPPVSQSICPNTISRSPDFLLRERKCSWNVMIMWCSVEGLWVSTTGGDPLLLRQLGGNLVKP